MVLNDVGILLLRCLGCFLDWIAGGDCRGEQDRRSKIGAKYSRTNGHRNEGCESLYTLDSG